jgi:glycosyltransferase involved in cell wall biosynthesis
MFVKAKSYLFKSKVNKSPFSDEFFTLVFNESFYRSVYGDVLGKFTPQEHFSRHFESLDFDPCSTLVLKDISALHTELTTLELLEKCVLDSDFFSENKTISPMVFNYFQITEFTREKKDILILKYIVDESYYYESSPDVKRSWLEPYLHYALFGAKEFRNPTSSFNTSIYVKTYDDLSDNDINPFVHYFEFGKKEGRVKNSSELDALNERESWIKKVTLFDIEYYLENNLDVKEANLDAFEHFCDFGETEGRKPNKYFDPEYYLLQNPDVKENGLSPFSHFCEFGIYENREFENKEVTKAIVHTEEPLPQTSFDADYYLQNNPDIKSAGVDPYEHYRNSGEKEGRSPNKYFSPNFYKSLNADVRSAGVLAFDHFCTNGFYEKRLGIAPLFNVRTNVKKSLLFVGHDGIQAGSEIVLLEIIKWFYFHTDRKLKVLLLSPGPLANNYAAYADIYVLPEYIVDDPDALIEFIQDDFEFCYVNTVVSGMLFDFLNEHSFALNCDVIAHIHEMEKVIAENLSSFENLKKYSSHFISASPATTDVLITKHAINKEDITTVPAFIKIVDPYLSNREVLKNKMRHEFGIPNTALVVGGCGTVYWRKGPDIFLESARQVLQQSDMEIHFVWIGPGPDLNELKGSLTEQESNFIHFVGERSDANEAIAVADIFYMSSREDPFPLVVMESAQHCIPTVCFAEATGITAFVQDDAGVCLEYIDAEKAAEAILMLSEDREKLSQMGNVARNRVTDNYTSEIQCLNIYQALQKNTPYKPSVSVIVPMYNHEAFIDERIQSILNQSIKDIEIIVLDDCSKDKSIENAKYYEVDFRLKVTGNKINSGSPFAQWKKGLSKAQADVVWIAEGDDACDNNFIETLLPYFDDELVNIASGKTVITNENGIPNPTALEPYLDSAYQDKYKNSFVIDGYEEVNQNFGAVCTLVNASGLLIRKDSVDLSILHQASDFKMCGDWLIYLAALRGGKLAYDVSTNNYFRRHSASVVNKIEGSDVYFNERYKITEFVFNNFNVTNKLVRRVFEAIDGEWARFKYKHEDKQLIDLYDKVVLSGKVNIQESTKHIGLYVHGMLFSKGGIERLATDLANYFVEQGFKVTIYARSWGKESKPVYALYNNVQVKGVFDETQQEQTICKLRKALLDDKVDVFIPMLSEWLFTPIIEAAKYTGIPVIASEHNDPWKIEELWWKREERLNCFEQVEHIHLLLNKFSESLPLDAQSKISTIPNGIELPKSITPYAQREKLIVGIGRLAEQKRFDRLIEAVSLIKETLMDNGWRVEVYGEGHLRSDLQRQIEELGVADLVTLQGVTNDISTVLNQAAINIMPSEFEGFGIALVEAMAHGLPSIAFEECNGPNEIITNKTGVLVSSVDALADELNQLIKNDKKRKIQSKNALFASKQYDKAKVFPLWIGMINKVLG